MSARLVLVVFLDATLAGCAAPGQYGGPIPVNQAGTAARLERLCAIAEQAVCGAVAADEDAGPGDARPDDAGAVDAGRGGD
jgi:hypothetical protein